MAAGRDRLSVVLPLRHARRPVPAAGRRRPRGCFAEVEAGNRAAVLQAVGEDVSDPTRWRVVHAHPDPTA